MRRRQRYAGHGGTGIAYGQFDTGQPSNAVVTFVNQKRPEHNMNAVTRPAGDVQVRRHKTTDVIDSNLQRRVRFFTDRRALDAEKKWRELHRVAGLNLRRQRVVVSDNAQRLGKTWVHQLQGVEHNACVVGVGVGFFFGGCHTTVFG